MEYIGLIPRVLICVIKEVISRTDVSAELNYSCRKYVCMLKNVNKIVK